MMFRFFIQKFKKDSIKIPENYTVGEEYFNDSKEILATFSVFFPSSSMFESVEQKVDGVNLILENSGTYISLQFQRKISEKLFKDLRCEIGIDWLIGYIAPYIDYLNQEIYKQRYRVDGFLLQPYSVLNINHVVVKEDGSRREITVRFPRTVQIKNIFEPQHRFNTIYLDCIHIRDLIDAINAFFYSNFDDCVRRLITSIETSFDYYEFDKIRDSKNGSVFKGTLEKNCTGICSMTGKNISAEIWKLYRLRTDIVHDGYRIKPSEKKVCDEGIHYVLDYFKGLKIAPDLYGVIMEIEGRWIMYKQYTGQLLTLDKLKEIKC